MATTTTTNQPLVQKWTVKVDPKYYDINKWIDSLENGKIFDITFTKTNGNQVNNPEEGSQGLLITTKNYSRGIYAIIDIETIRKLPKNIDVDNLIRAG